MSRVAFIGLGTMGLPMARNLLAAGHEVVACDLDSTRAEALGAPVAATAAEEIHRTCEANVIKEMGATREAEVKLPPIVVRAPTGC